MTHTMFMLNKTQETTNDLTEIFGEVIHSYTREEAVEDGVLVDLTNHEVAAQHFTGRQVFLTASLWAIVEKAVANKRWCNDLNGVLHDVFHMASIYALGRGIDAGETKRFIVIIKGAGRKSKFYPVVAYDGVALTFGFSEDF